MISEDENFILWSLTKTKTVGFQVDDKKDEDVVAVLLDEPAPEGELQM